MIFVSYLYQVTNYTLLVDDFPKLPRSGHELYAVG